MRLFRPRPPPDPAREAAKAEALATLVRALEAAKHARDAGYDVREARATLKLARDAFEAGEYAKAAAHGEEILRRLALRPPPGP